MQADGIYDAYFGPLNKILGREVEVDSKKFYPKYCPIFRIGSIIYVADREAAKQDIIGEVAFGGKFVLALNGNNQLKWELNDILHKSHLFHQNLLKRCREERIPVKKDIFQIVLDTISDIGSKFTDLEAFDQNLEIAGSDTTGFSMALILLAKHPEKLQKLIKEFETVIPSIGLDNLPDQETQNQLPNLNAVVNETLRLYPTLRKSIRFLPERWLNPDIPADAFYSFSAAGLDVDLVQTQGLQFFKKFNLSSPGIAKQAKSFLDNSSNNALKNKNPYSVINSTIKPPNSDTHEYYSWAPYQWPDCTGIKGVTDEATQCPYKQRDGEYITDLNKLSDKDDVGTMVKDVITLSLAYTLYGDEKYAAKATQLLYVWFLNNETAMVPRVDFGQVVRGPGEWKGRSEGILDMRGFVYIPPAIELIKGSSSWSSKLSNGMINWFTQYSDWLQNSDLGKGARSASNNHGTFYVVQLATYLDFIGKKDDAKKAINNFLQGQFQNQISKSGEQPLESRRTRPYHYQCFNLIALTYIARLSQRINGPNLWEAKTSSGVTIQNAAHYMAVEAMPKNNDKNDCMVPLYAARLYYGDSGGILGTYLSKVVKLAQGSDLSWMIWDPLALNGLETTTSVTA
ncbi:hypothetical protein G9A89_001035 [Geosiphon pyriformis]|nr:hypothetical protein G9A89_001035 [Geosiphon pyriformis]